MQAYDWVMCFAMRNQQWLIYYVSFAFKKRETKIILIMYISSICATYNKSEYNNFFFVYRCV